MKSLDLPRVRFATLAILLAGLSAYAGEPLIDDNEKAIDVIVNTFSILAGFLVAIIAVVGDPSLLPAGSWRAAEANREKIKRRLIRYKWLFVMYLTTLALVFLSLLLQKKPEWTHCLQSAFLFFGVLSFTFSLKLPTALIAAQQEKIDALIEQRRKEEGIAGSQVGSACPATDVVARPSE